jgi:hypothetical protein
VCMCDISDSHGGISWNVTHTNVSEVGVCLSDYVGSHSTRNSVMILYILQQTTLNTKNAVMQSGRNLL